MQSNIAAQPQFAGLFKFTTLGNMVSNLWGVAFMVGAAVAFVFVAMGALEWITGGGDKGKVEEAKNRITQGMVGLAILAVSWAVALVVQRFLGLNILVGGSGSTGGTGGTGGTGTCDGWAVAGSTHCRNQDCMSYTCTSASCWTAAGGPEPTCAANRSAGCYGVNSGFDASATVQLCN